MDEIKDLIAIRPYTQDDIPFVVNAWLHGFKQGCEYFRLIDGNAYKDVYGQVIHTILERASTDIKIVCLKDDQEIILGYSVTEVRPGQVILHWIYVKPDWRDNGIAAMLAPDKITHATHLTKTGRALLKKHPNVAFNPFII